jgi:hypothetical protein
LLKGFSNFREFLMTDRKLADSITIRPYEDNVLYLQTIVDTSGRPLRELLREFVDEGVKARSNPSVDFSADIARCVEPLVEQIRMLREENRLLAERYEGLFKRYEQLAERAGKLKQGVVTQLRLIVGILGEALAAAIGARQMTWNYVAYESLKGSKKYTDSEIKARLDAEIKASYAERDARVNEVKRIDSQKHPAE